LLGEAISIGIHMALLELVDYVSCQSHDKRTFCQKESVLIPSMIFAYPPLNAQFINYKPLTTKANRIRLTTKRIFVNTLSYLGIVCDREVKM
jgi:hypothetical protein